MATHEGLKQIALTRLEEAKILYDNSKYDGAVYLCGYVLEVALKARICNLLKLKEYPDRGKSKNIFTIHDFEILFKLAGLEAEIELKKKSSSTFFANWYLLASSKDGWTPEIRYKAIGSYTKAMQRSLLMH